MEILIKRISVAEAFDDPAFPLLLLQYEAESAIGGMPSCNASRETYELMERNGALHVIGAYVDGDLVGFLSMLITLLPHYSAPAATVESFFVADYARQYGIGDKLRQFAEHHAAINGAAGMLVSAPAGGRLERVMRGSKTYRHTNTVFFKALT